MSSDPAAEAGRELDDARAALIAARLDTAQWRAQAKTWEDNAGQAVELANRELRKRQEAYAKLDILMGEYRRIALALAEITGRVAGHGLVADDVAAITGAFLERLSGETDRLPPGASSVSEDAVDAGMASGGAGTPRAQPA